MTTPHPDATTPSACDWCGESFAEGERRFQGYDKFDTHGKCLGAALHAWNQDRFWREARFGIDSSGPEREPFNDWPNGQGTYD